MSLVALPPAGAVAGVLPAQVIFQSGAGPPLRLRLAPAGGAAGGLNAQLVSGILVALPPAGGTAAMLPAPHVFFLPRPPQPPLATWQRDIQGWAITQERLRHVQSLWQYGELAVFCLMWHLEDFQAGLVGRCLRCYDDGTGSEEDQISAAYGQGSQYRCTDCFGTTFEGGFRALIVRPAIFTDMDKDQRRDKRGVVNTGEVNIESTPDFRVRNGDYSFRSTGDRFYLRVPRRTTLRTGFASPWQAAAAIDYNHARGAVEDPASVAYVIPPSALILAQVLGTYTRLPVDFSDFEIIRAPLIPEETVPPAASGALQPDVTIPG